MATAEIDDHSQGHDDSHGHDDHHGPAWLAHHFDSPEQQFDSGKLGMWLFLITEILFFSGLFCAYAIYRSLRPEVYSFASQFLNTELGAINTGVLLFSSLTMAWAVRAAQLEQHKLLVGMLAATIGCAMIFLGVKAVEYSHKWHIGLLPAGMYCYDEAIANNHTAIVAFGPQINAISEELESTEIALKRQDKLDGIGGLIADTRNARDKMQQLGVISVAAKLDESHQLQEQAAVDLASGKNESALSKLSNARVLFEEARHKVVHPPYLLYLSIIPGLLVVGLVGMFMFAKAVGNKLMAYVAPPLIVAAVCYFVGVGLGIFLEAKHAAAHEAHATAHHADLAHPTEDHNAETASPEAGTENEGQATVLDLLAQDKKNTGVLSELEARRAQEEMAGGIVLDGSAADGESDPFYGRAEIDVNSNSLAGVFFSIYYCMTGLHAVHIILGIATLVWLLVRAAREDFNKQYFGPVDYVGLYWHIVDLIWIYLFPLLYLIG